MKTTNSKQQVPDNQGTGFVIPVPMWPERAMREVQGRDGRTYLVRNDAMFTGVQHAQGEFSEFFLALRDEMRIFAHQCPECSDTIIPPFQKRCPFCNFAEMEKVYVRDVGVLDSTPVITIFAPSRFKDEVPFGTGRVYIEMKEGEFTDTAMLVRVRTTRGAIRPGIYHRGTAVKVVFADTRQGEILDMFVVPQSELTPDQIEKSPLMESDLEWGKIEQVRFKEFDPGTLEAVRREVMERFTDLGRRITKSPRAKANLANWNRAVEIKTSGGSLALYIQDGELYANDGVPSVTSPDLVMTVPDPERILLWLRDATKTSEDNLESPALTDLVVEGTIWLDRSELETITRLDRVPRSLRRDGVV